MSNSDRLIQLRKMIDRCDEVYYNTGDLLLIDAQYDALKAELRKLAPEDSRHARIGAPVPKDSMRTKFKHTCFMGSLDKCDTSDDLRKWYKSTMARCGAGALHVSLKVDGGSLALYYERGKLVRAVTRGGDDGVGEDITANAVHFRDVPTELPSRATVAVRGECVLKTPQWLEVDPEKKSNARNLGNGIMGRLDGKDAGKLSFLAFDIEASRDISSENLKMAMLEKLGFAVVPNELVDDVEAALIAFDKIAERRDTYDYMIDGVVFKCNLLETQKLLGIRDNRPKGQIVLKFEAEGAETVLEDVALTVGHTGAIIPTGKIAPVRIGGTTVKSVLLNNFQMITDLDLAIGDKIRVIKAKDIIPMCQGVLDRFYTCPECGFKGTLTEQEAHHKSR